MFWDVVGFLGLKYTSPYSKHLDSNGTCEWWSLPEWRRGRHYGQPMATRCIHCRRNQLPSIWPWTQTIRTFFASLWTSHPRTLRKVATGFGRLKWHCIGRWWGDADHAKHTAHHIWHHLLPAVLPAQHAHYQCCRIGSPTSISSWLRFHDPTWWTLGWCFGPFCRWHSRVASSPPRGLTRRRPQSMETSHSQHDELGPSQYLLEIHAR